MISDELAAAAKGLLVLLHREGIKAALLGELPDGRPLVICQAERDVVPLYALIQSQYETPEGATVN